MNAPGVRLLWLKICAYIFAVRHVYRSIRAFNVNFSMWFVREVIIYIFLKYVVHVLVMISVLLYYMQCIFFLHLMVTPWCPLIILCFTLIRINRVRGELNSIAKLTQIATVNIAALRKIIIIIRSLCMFISGLFPVVCHRLTKIHLVNNSRVKFDVSPDKHHHKQNRQWLSHLSSRKHKSTPKRIKSTEQQNAI